MSNRIEAVTPKPTVEVAFVELDVPDEDDEEAVASPPKKTKGFRLFPTKTAATFFFNNSIGSSIEELRETPDLSAASAASSFVPDVTDMIHLDGNDSFEDHNGADRSNERIYDFAYFHCCTNSIV